MPFNIMSYILSHEKNMVLLVKCIFYHDCYSINIIEINVCLYMVFLVMLSISQNMNIVTLTVSFQDNLYNTFCASVPLSLIKNVMKLTTHANTYFHI